MRGFRIASRPYRAAAAVLSMGLLAATGCAGGDKQATTTGGAERACDGRIEGTPTVQAWIHAGIGHELQTQRELAAKFNASQAKVKVELTVLPAFPEGLTSFYDFIQAGQRAGTLPSLMEFDGPDMASLAYRRQLLPLDTCVPASLRDDLLPSVLDAGTYQGKLYALGAQGDSGLGLYSRRSVLRKAGIRIPTGPADAWTADEVTAMLPKLKAQGFSRPLDLKISVGDEWFTYGFSPAIESAGGDLVRRPALDRAQGVLNSPESVGALKTLQRWQKAGYVDDDADERAFVGGRSAISWIGHWMYKDYLDKFGDDLVILPLPNFGKRTVTGMGSWVWGLSNATKDMDAAWSYLAFLMRPENQRTWSSASYLIPATRSGARSSPLYAPGGPLRLFYDQLANGYAVPRPATPGYPVITKAFQAAFEDIMVKGGDVQAALNKAAATIDADMKAHDDYKAPFVAPSPKPTK